MKVDRPPQLARRFFDRFEPVHAVTYFCAGVPYGVRRPRVPRLLDGILRGPIGAAGRRTDRGGDGDLLQLRTKPGRQGAARRMGDRVAGAALRAREDSAVAALAPLWPHRRRCARPPPNSRQGGARRPTGRPAIVRGQPGAALAVRTAGAAVACGHAAARTARRRHVAVLAAQDSVAANPTCCTPPRAGCRGR